MQAVEINRSTQRKLTRLQGERATSTLTASKVISNADLWRCKAAALADVPNMANEMDFEFSLIVHVKCIERIVTFRKAAGFTFGRNIHALGESLR